VKRALRLATALAVLLLLIATLLGPGLGAFLVAEDPLVKADVIYVLGGTLYERPLEAVDLYNAGWAPRVLLSRQVSDWGELALAERGIEVPHEIDLQLRVMEQLGVPASAIDVLDREQDSTADESDALLAIATPRHWSRVIVVTSKQHTRRAGLAMRRRLAGTGVTVTMRASRYDRSDVEHWWRTRSTLRFTLFETQRYLAYWLRLAD
jgi:uncharacterized SAM-binding protein YcdF (DUF218 family)